MIGYSTWSLVFHYHRCWYAWLLESLVALVYGGGFIVMTPQLFINYRLKSVAHLPWKFFMYKVGAPPRGTRPSLRRLRIGLCVHAGRGFAPTVSPRGVGHAPHTSRTHHARHAHRSALLNAPPGANRPACNSRAPPPPWQALNTFIDDLFAFIIKMPTLHRMSCFRDDIVFAIFLYQRYIYRVDMSRVNEFGHRGEETDEAKEEDNGAAAAAGGEGEGGKKAEGKKSKRSKKTD